MDRSVQQVLNFAFHEGERYLHQKTQVNDLSSAQNGSIIRTFMPQQHRDFYEMIPFLVVGTRDPLTQKIWASILVAPEGKQLAKTPSNSRIDFDVDILKGDPLEDILSNHSLKVSSSSSSPSPSSSSSVPPLFMGMLGIELPTRRRNRVNGKIHQAKQGKQTKSRFMFSMDVDFTFGNCPKYIQTRDVVRVPNTYLSQGEIVKGGSVLPEEAKSLVTKSDTLFWASSSVLNENEDTFNDRRRGVDVSHRGGKPGFVKVTEVTIEEEEEEKGVKKGVKNILTFPDYIGNFMFQTLGNIHMNPQCGLIFLDFDQSNVLYLSGKAYIDYEDQSMPGSQRMIHFHLEDFVFSKKSLPFKFEFKQESIYLPELDVQPGIKNKFGLKKITVTCREIKEENYNTKTYTFGANLAVASHQKPGQYATFDIPYNNELITRTWTISSAPAGAGEYRFSITVKKQPNGFMSKYLFDELNTGDEFILRGIEGDFTMDLISKDSEHVIFFAGGIGITPFISMLRGIYSKVKLDVDSMKKKSLEFNRKMDLIYSVKNEEDVIFFDELVQYTKIFPHFNLHLYFSSSPSNEFVPNSVSNVSLKKGRLTLEDTYSIFKYDTSKTEAMICGPETYMQNVQSNLEKIGLKKGSIHLEAFNY